MILTLMTIVYVLCAVLLSLYAVGAIVLLVSYLKHRHIRILTPQVDIITWPKAAIQLPLYNERFVVERLLEAVAMMDYPRDRYVVQVLDDSEDDTVELVAQVVARLKATGLNIEHVCRPNRTGYKAGALAYGMELLKEHDIEYVAVLDADFVPPPDFLKNTIPHMIADPKLGMVQGRWGHLNWEGNLLTRGQAMALDGHFIVEQAGRNSAGWLMNFNGSGGIWRVKAIEEAGGWNDITLTEDLDLSYRAQLLGWRFLFLPDVIVPGELPPLLSAYKQQQARWAKGGTQCLALLIGPIWHNPYLSKTQRLMATLHLCQYLTAPMVVLLVLLTPPLVAADQMQKLPLGFLGLAGLGPPLLFIISQQALYTNWKQRILALPALITIGTGMALNNTRAVLGGLMSQRGEFKRTPKYAANHKQAARRYLLQGDKLVVFEALFALYALLGATLALDNAPTLVPYLVIYAFSFGLIALWSMKEMLSPQG